MKRLTLTQFQIEVLITGRALHHEATKTKSALDLIARGLYRLTGDETPRAVSTSLGDQVSGALFVLQECGVLEDIEKEPLKELRSVLQRAAKVVNEKPCFNCLGNGCPECVEEGGK